MLSEKLPELLDFPKDLASLELAAKVLDLTWYSMFWSLWVLTINDTLIELLENYLAECRYN